MAGSLKKSKRDYGDFIGNNILCGRGGSCVEKRMDMDIETLMILQNLEPNVEVIADYGKRTQMGFQRFWGYENKNH